MKRKLSGGFTLVEAIFSLLILSILMLAASSGMVQIASGLIKVRGATENVLTQQSGAYLKDLFISASPTYHFLHVPVQLTGCGTTQPCIRLFDTASSRFIPNEKVAAAPSLTSALSANAPQGLAHLEFFRDYNGGLVSEESPALESGPGGGTQIHAYVLHSKPVDLRSLINDPIGPSVYATWPMVDEKSPAFPLLTQKQDYVVLTHYAQAGTQNPGDATVAFFKPTSQKPIDPQTFANSLAILFNVDEPSQYGMQYIRSVTPCGGGNLDKCKGWMEKLNSAVANDPTLSKDIGNLVAVELVSVNEAPDPIPNQFQTLLPSIADVAPNASGSSSWPNQSAASFFMFPITSFPIYEKNLGVLESTDLNPPMDVRRLQHYYTTRYSAAQLVLLPVSLRVFHLKPRTADARTLDLVSQVIGEKTDLIQMDDIIANPNYSKFTPPGQVMYFARKIGSTTLDIVVEQK